MSIDYACRSLSVMHPCCITGKALSMSWRQMSFSVLCILCSVAGLFAIVRDLLIGFDGLVLGVFSLMFLFALAAIRIMQRQAITDEAVLRLGQAPQWRDLSPSRRRRMMLFDWPLFWAIREREVERLLGQPLTRVVLEPQGIKLVPIEPQHTEAYFLTKIGNMAETRGLKVNNATQGIFGRRWAGAKSVDLTWLGSDERIWNNARSELIDGGSISLREFDAALEWGYISTLPEAERFQHHWVYR